MRAAIILVVCATACSRSDLPEPSTLELAPRTSAAPVGESTAVVQAWAVAQQHGCLPLWPVRLVFDGVIRSEVYLGPPGYGETPKQDRRDTIAVLDLERDVPVCNDSAEAPLDPVIRVRRVQLTGHAAAALNAVGIRVTVFGTLGRRIRGSDYLPALLRADSIPSLRRTARSSSD